MVLDHVDHEKMYSPYKIVGYKNTRIIKSFILFFY
jgi:hypothetical protein